MHFQAAKNDTCYLSMKVTIEQNEASYGHHTYIASLDIGL